MYKYNLNSTLENFLLFSRWSVAAQSISSNHGINNATTPNQIIATPTIESIPMSTMSKLTNSSVSVHGERKISFVIQDDSESCTSSQTTLAISASYSLYS